MPPLSHPLASYKPPVFVGTVITPKGLRLLNRINSNGAQIIEVRGDELLARGAKEEQIELALIERAHPVLLTLRIPAEGGAYKWRKGQREALYLKWLPYVDLIDIELAEVKSLRRVLQAAQRAEKSVILSSHSLKTALTEARLKQLVGEFSKYPVSCYKIAALVKTKDDLQRLASLLFQHQNHPWVVMGVGHLAAYTRLIYALLGSRLAYGYLDSPAAPGQPSIAKLRRLLAPFNDTRATR
jgi:3-dehydroquinate dehydratase I